uniref:Thiazole synthase n=3 Tax=Saccharina TaxID=309357 RepID=A0A8K1ST11_9PHAE|nr:thiamine biosynthesis protein G [Saccharina japonica]YP_010863345.1 thiamine biosynthesis protein G [Saccharina japonica x Saccharina latissima]QOV02225.1 thiamine biosynthesis protein G [Saccharina sp. ye-B]UFQ24763.1 thiamine biosynthesis protein G [Saccharina sp. Rongfu]WAX38109.1 thiamin biosynthesis protein G [Saccharina japonica cultivar 901]AFC40088.1 thiamine biosynthesis protein G [Saccharina japonica]UFQ24901.1 thiamine biosynthesis protein G [Saccharina sp. Rongfu]
MLKQDQLTIGGKVFNSRLIVGTGKYRSLKEMVECLAKSESEMVTVAIRRLNLLNISKNDNLITAIDWKKLWLLPNTAGAKTAEEAIRLAFLGRELSKRIGQKENNFIKLEVISDPKYLFPDPIGTLKAAEFLVKKGFIVLPYTNTDPMLAKHLEDIGCSTIMPLGSPIGSGQGIQSINNIQIIIENSKIPVIIDAGIGSPSEAALAMELGAEAVLINTAIAQAKNSMVMATAMNLAVQAGRQAYLAGQMSSYKFAQSSSPLKGSNFLNLSKK